MLPRRRTPARLAATVLTALALVGSATGCWQQATPAEPAGSGAPTAGPAAEASPGEPTSPPAQTPSAPASSPAESATSSPRPTEKPPAPGTVPPEWLGERVLPETAEGYGVVRSTPPELRHRRFTLPDRLPALPGHGFASRVTPAPDRVLARSTWEPGCPVGRDELAWVRLTFHGFDGERHTGELLVHTRVAEDVVEVFGKLYAARFPIEEMRITTSAELDAEPTGDGSNTGAFVCRPSTGSDSTYSQHAYGLAIDVNPFHNPYVKDDLVLPELASAYLDRSRRAPGMIHPGDAVVRAFASVGWEWGGAWSSAKDYQHFSENGR